MPLMATLVFWIAIIQQLRPFRALAKNATAIVRYCLRALGFRCILLNPGKCHAFEVDADRQAAHCATAIAHSASSGPHYQAVQNMDRCSATSRSRFSQIFARF